MLGAFCIGTCWQFQVRSRRSVSEQTELVLGIQASLSGRQATVARRMIRGQVAMTEPAGQILDFRCPFQGLRRADHVLDSIRDGASCFADEAIHRCL